MKNFYVLMDETNGGDGGAASGGAAPAAAAAGKAAAAGGAGTTPTAANGSAATPAAAATPSVAATPATAATAATPAAAAAAPAKSDWPDDWQVKLAGGDDKAAKDLAKFQSPRAVYESYAALQRRLSSGELKAALPKNPTEADLTAWRKDNGVPDKPEAYDLKLTAVKEIPKESKPVIDAFLKSAHGANMTNEQASAAVDSYLAIQKQEAQARLERDDADRGKALDAIAKEWGGALSRNKSLIGNALQIFPQAVRDQLMNARLPDGSALFNNVDVLRGFLAMEMEKNPAGVIAPAGGGDIGKTAIEEYQGLQKFMRENRDAYNKDTVKQGRVTELIGFLSEKGLIDNNGNVLQQKKAA